ncbi:stearoyl-coa desaturase [Culex quinquefasciatus]|uniref:Stearoyl-coa desaturase n=1 Tax=Culex quinquefasciatus TaxID=7176 RepID=B0XL02_CULQU|nr:stearoyl-coa desaturase [Culex quinquefasciatus]|eukprot:XP_001870324.1 stearoyl-coa desaturase [Culex quinquefasciatus]
MSAPIVAVRITNSATYSRSRNYRSAGHHRLAQPTLCAKTFKKLSSDDALAVMSSAETTTPTGSSGNSRTLGSSSNGCTTRTTTTTTTPASSSQPKSRDTTREASWPWVLFYIHLNILGVYGIFVLFSHTSAITLVFTAFLTLCGILGATAGAHRLWAHKTYHASTLLRFILMLCQTMAGQYQRRLTRVADTYRELKPPRVSPNATVTGITCSTCAYPGIPGTLDGVPKATAVTICGEARTSSGRVHRRRAVGEPPWTASGRARVRQLEEAEVKKEKKEGAEVCSRNRKVDIAGELRSTTGPRRRSEEKGQISP